MADMATRPMPENWWEVEDEIAERAWRDSSFRERLLADPKTTIEKMYGVSFRSDLAFRIVEQPLNVLHINLPEPPPGMETPPLDDNAAQIQPIFMMQAGTVQGTSSHTRRCCTKCCQTTRGTGCASGGQSGSGSGSGSSGGGGGSHGGSSGGGTSGGTSGGSGSSGSSGGSGGSGGGSTTTKCWFFSLLTFKTEDPPTQ